MLINSGSNGSVVYIVPLLQVKIFSTTDIEDIIIKSCCRIFMHAVFCEAKLVVLFVQHEKVVLVHLF